jgi:hypothetical protein
MLEGIVARKVTCPRGWADSDKVTLALALDDGAQKFHAAGLIAIPRSACRGRYGEIARECLDLGRHVLEGESWPVVRRPGSSYSAYLCGLQSLYMRPLALSAIVVSSAIIVV